VLLRAVIFDLDGTLADSATAEQASWPSLAAVVGSRTPGLDEDEFRRRYHSVFRAHWDDFLHGRIDFGEYRRRRLEEALAPWRPLDDELFDAYRAEKRRTIERLRPFDDAVETIERLRAAGLGVGLLTNGPSWLQRAKLEVTGLGAQLDAIAISEEIGVSKPEVAAFRVAAAMLGAHVGETAMVGDSPVYDAAGAMAAGLAHAVLVAHDPTVDGNGASVVATLSELPDVLGLGG
jgi:putative hydrolase of the HAD superfamily